MVLIARSIDIPTIAGERYFSLFEQDVDHTNSKKTDANAQAYLSLFEEARSAADAIVHARINHAQEADQALARAWSPHYP
jgi:hypothetical protein